MLAKIETRNWQYHEITQQSFKFFKDQKSKPETWPETSVSLGIKFAYNILKQFYV